MRLFSPLFWGVFLLSSGAVILISLVFTKLDIHVGKLLFGLFVLLVGVSLLTNSLGWENFTFSRDNTVAFSNGDHAVVEPGKEYFAIFGSAYYDATKLEPGTKAKINCLFGSCTVRLPAGNVKVFANSAFGTVRLPDGESVSFGSREYGSDTGDTVTVEVMSAFGSATVVRP